MLTVANTITNTMTASTHSPVRADAPAAKTSTHNRGFRI
jgi:hypothetical protein